MQTPVSKAYIKLDTLENVFCFSSNIFSLLDSEEGKCGRQEPRSLCVYTSQNSVLCPAWTSGSSYHWQSSPRRFAGYPPRWAIVDPVCLDLRRVARNVNNFLQDKYSRSLYLHLQETARGRQLCSIYQGCDCIAPCCAWPSRSICHPPPLFFFFLQDLPFLTYLGVSSLKHFLQEKAALCTPRLAVWAWRGWTDALLRLALLENQLELLTGDLSDGTNLPKSRIPTPATEPAGTGAA